MKAATAASTATPHHTQLCESVCMVLPYDVRLYCGGCTPFWYCPVIWYEPASLFDKRQLRTSGSKRSVSWVRVTRTPVYSRLQTSAVLITFAAVCAVAKPPGAAETLSPYSPPYNLYSSTRNSLSLSCSLQHTRPLLVQVFKHMSQKI